LKALLSLFPFSARRHRRHGGPHTKLARLIACSGYDTPCPRSADSHRLAFKGRIVALFHGRIESVHVNVNDLPLRPLFDHSRACRSELGWWHDKLEGDFFYISAPRADVLSGG
jgi:hypothetical protein